MHRIQCKGESSEGRWGGNFRSEQQNDGKNYFRVWVENASFKSLSLNLSKMDRFSDALSFVH